MKNYSLSTILSLLLIMLILDSKAVTLSSSCQSESCGNVKIPYPFGIQEGCYLSDWYRIECRSTTFPFLSKTGIEVVNISFSGDGKGYYTSTRSFGSIRIKSPIASVGCSRDGKESGSVLNLTDSPFIFGRGNSLVAVGCDGKASLTNIEPNNLECKLNCTASKESLPRKSIPFLDGTGCSNDGLPYAYRPVCTKDMGEEDRSCDGNRCCQASLPEDAEAHQVVGVRIESPDHGNSTSRECRVAFLTDEVYTLSNATNPQSFYAKGYATATIGWVLQTNNLSFINSLSCKTFEEYINITYTDQFKTSCMCYNTTISGTSYANCACNQGYRGNPHLFNGCTDINECLQKPSSDGSRSWHCGVGTGFGILLLAGGIWFLRKYLKKRKVTQSKKKFYKRNGGLLLEQQLNTREGNVDKTKLFSSRELAKATENFSDNRILGQGGQGTVYKGMLVDGKTVAVKKSKAVDEDKLEEFINEVVILSEVNHRHVVKLLGCCLETEVPILVYEFIPNGNLFQHIHEESDDYTMIWGLITGEKPVVTLSDSQEIRGLADHFRAAMKENKFFDIMDARIRDACKPEQVVAVANLARRCLNSKGKKRPYMRQVFTELEKIGSSPEDSLVEIENGDGDDEEEEGMNMLEITDSWTIGVTAPAPSTVASSSLTDVKPLFPRPTW
ncbi:unnamed protein product [Thlaspi arvense]|uniref:Protein kinase domain-containing protein n=1 Tax=Thlaspi arvense TaxID=13288 RepID=A0AAU9RAU9_THLAR|nr:unnamed protein product [Thlaspi arvense]